MIGQLVALLAAAEAAGKGSYALCVTGALQEWSGVPRAALGGVPGGDVRPAPPDHPSGPASPGPLPSADRACRLALPPAGDHSTPVVFGDHSHEPVPFALAHVRHVVGAMGGAPQLALRRPGHMIPLPDVKAPLPPLEELLLQARQQAARRAAAAAGRPFAGPAGPQAGASGAGAALGAGGGGQQGSDVGAWAEAWPQAVLGDSVAAFDELSAASGSLGRFPGSQVMPLLKQFAGQTP